MNRGIIAATRVLTIALAAQWATPIFAQNAAPSAAERNHDPDREPVAVPALLLDISARHPRILERARELASKLAAANYSSSRYPDPGLGVAWSNYPYKKDLKLVEHQTPMTGVEFTVSQPIPFPGRLTLESKIADVDANASRLRLAIEKNLVAQEFLSALIDAQTLRETAILARSFVERTQIVSEVAETRYAVGKGNLTDVSKASVHYSAFRDRVRNLEGALEARYRNLGYYLEEGAEGSPDAEAPGDAADPEDVARQADDSGRPPTTARLDRVLAAPGERGLPGYLQTLQDSLKGRDLLRGRESLAVALSALEIDRQEKQEYLAQMQYLPDFEVFASYRKRGNVPNDPAQDEDFMSFGFKMRIPLWSALANHSNVEARSEMQKSARFAERNVLERERSLLDQARINYQTLNERLTLYNENLIPQATQSVDSARLAYETGRADFDAFLGSWEMLYNLEAERIRLRADRDRQVLVMAFILNVILPEHSINRASGDPS